ncbi:MAG: hypothetical protein SO101_10860 [Lachnospiraceae bacterium]|nr:hypothetical protein [Lachnospiraceae bacterium]
MPVPSMGRKCGIVLTYGSAPECEAEKAAGLFTLCGNLAGFGSSKLVLCGNENAKDAFTSNWDYQEKVKELLSWIIDSKVE